MVMKNEEAAGTWPVQPPAAASVEFPVHRLRTAEVLWVHPAFASAQFPGSPGADQQRRSFGERFAFAISDSACFSGMDFDRTTTRTAIGERYGGRGIGVNGGGVRVGNFGGCQVKGIGQNPLVGMASPFLHRYGALTAGEAVYEAIYAYLLDTITPIGAIRINGVILTGAKAAYLRYRDDEPESASAGFKCRGALMVREMCRRPAHFLRAPQYTPAERYADMLASDVTRVRAANIALFRECGGAEGFVTMLAMFLQNCAKQFAFGSVNGLAHGTLTPSNVAMDGRWLDLARSTFFPITENNGAFVPSSSEWQFPLTIVREWTRTFAKYNRLDLDTKTLEEYYNRLYLLCRQLCLFDLCGLEWFESGDADVVAACPEFAALALRIIDAPRLRTMYLPVRADHDDRMCAWLTWLMCPRLETSSSLAAAMRAQFSEDELQRARTLYDRLAAATRHACASSASPYFDPVDRLIEAVKSIRLREFFYKKRLDDVIFDTVENGTEAELRALIDDATALTDWAFTGPAPTRNWLFRGNGVDIYRDRETRCFLVVTDSTRCHATATLMLLALDDLPDATTTLARFQFKPYLRYLLSLLVTVEQNHHPM